MIYSQHISSATAVFDFITLDFCSCLSHRVVSFGPGDKSQCICWLLSSARIHFEWLLVYMFCSSEIDALEALAKSRVSFERRGVWRWRNRITWKFIMQYTKVQTKDTDISWQFANQPLELMPRCNAFFAHRRCCVECDACVSKYSRRSKHVAWILIFSLAFDASEFGALSPHTAKCEDKNKWTHFILKYSNSYFTGLHAIDLVRDGINSTKIKTTCNGPHRHGRTFATHDITANEFDWCHFLIRFFLAPIHWQG